MKKLILTLAMAGGLSPALCDTPSFMKFDFKYGMPQEFSLYDEDGNTPSADIAYAGFKKGVAWTAFDAEGKGRMVACSTSWYDPAGTSSDWMVLPALKVEAGAELTWSSRALDENVRDGYSVYVAEGDGTPESFGKSEPVFKIKEEDFSWTKHKVELGAYEGKTVRIAFVNDSHDCSMLLIDDIRAGVSNPLDIHIDFTPQVTPGTAVPIKINVTTDKEAGVKGFKTGFSCAGEEKVLDFREAEVKHGDSYPVDFSYTVTPGKNEVLECELWVETGSQRYSRKVNISGFNKRLVMEECTGTWCAYCVSGIVAIKDMTEKYGDDFISIAVHGGGSDPMEVMNSGYTFSINGYPTAFLNRNVSMHPTEWRDHADELLAQPAVAGIKAKASADGNDVRIATDLYFNQSYEESKFKLAYVVIENDVCVPDDAQYAQKNAYAGGAEGCMGGFENLPDVIPPDQMVYQEVARCILPEKYGMAGSVPDGIEAGVASHYDYTLSLPENVLNPANTEVVVLLLNDRNRQIENAAKVSLAPIYASVQGAASDNDCKVWCNEGVLSAVCGDAFTEICLYSTDGRLVMRQSPEAETFRYDLELPCGVYLWKANTVKGSFGGKVIVR